MKMVKINRKLDDILKDKTLVYGSYNCHNCNDCGGYDYYFFIGNTLFGTYICDTKIYKTDESDKEKGFYKIDNFRAKELLNGTLNTEEDISFNDLEPGMIVKHLINGNYMHLISKDDKVAVFEFTGDETGSTIKYTFTEKAFNESDIVVCQE